MRNAIRAWLVVPVLAVAACSTAPANWYSPTASVEQTQSTLAACRRQAANLAADDFDRRTGYMDPTIGPGSSSMSTRMAAHDSKVRESKLVADCMTARGFRPGKPGDGSRQ